MVSNIVPDSARSQYKYYHQEVTFQNYTKYVLDTLSLKALSYEMNMNNFCGYLNERLAEYFSLLFIQETSPASVLEARLSAVKAGAEPPFRMASNTSTSAMVVVSSIEIVTCAGPYGRRLTPCLTARSHTYNSGQVNETAA